MQCYLCARDNAREAIEVGDRAYYVCGTCSDVGLYCDSCEVPIADGDERTEIPGPWGIPTDRFRCGPCEETYRWSFQESRVVF